MMLDSASVPRLSIQSYPRALAGLVLLVSLVLCESAFAQAIDIPAITAPGRDGPKTAATLIYGHQFKVDVDNTEQEMARNNVFFGVAHSFDATEKTSVNLIANYVFQGYDFSSGTNGTPGPGLPTDFYQWDDVHKLTIGALFGYQVDERWRIIYGALARSWGERGAHFGKSLTVGAIGGFDYVPNENLSVGLLLGFFSALEDGASLVPIPTLKWKFAEDWRLNVGLVQVADPGIGAEIDWQISDEFAVGMGAAFQTRRFRLKDSTRVVQQNGNRNDDGGIGEEQQLPVFGLVRWRPAPRMEVDFQFGASFEGRLRVETNRGGRIHDDDYGIAPFGTLKATYAF